MNPDARNQLNPVFRGDSVEKPWLKSYEPGVPAEIEYPEGMLVHHILEQSADRFPNRPATIFPKALGNNLLAGRMSYRDIEQAANRFANALIGLGIQKGDRVALLLPNSPQFLIAYLGALKAGAIVVALNPLYAAAELERELNDCGAETVVTFTRSYAAVKQVQANTFVTRVIVTNVKEYFHPVVRMLNVMSSESRDGHRIALAPHDYGFQALLREANDARPELVIRADDLALLQYTAGTSDVPRGAMLTHRNLVANCIQGVLWRANVEQDAEAVLCTVPFIHLYGMQLAMLNSLYLGGVLILFPQFEVEQALMAVDRYQPTVFAGVPAIFAEIINYKDVDKHNLRSIRVCLSGAAPLSTQVQNAFEVLSGARVVESYGLTEAGALTHANPMQGERREGSIGIPVSSTEARVVDPEFPNVELPAGAIGELAIRGPQVFKGYWHRPEETAKTLQNGWLMTGDLARMDKDGYFYHVARKKDLILAGGFKIYPREIENVLVQHPKIREAAVVGVPDPYLDQVPKAFIVLEANETATSDEVFEFLHQNLAKFKIPRYLEFRSSLPKTVVGQVMRRELQEEATKSQAPAAKPHVTRA